MTKKKSHISGDVLKILSQPAMVRFNDASPDDIVRTTLYYRRLQLFCHRQKNLQYLAFQLQDIFSFS